MRPSPSSAGPLPAGTVVGSCYRILRLLGKGGMGEVYVVENLGSGPRQLALKALRSEHGDDPSLQKRFQSEIRSLENIRHPLVVQLLDAGFCDTQGLWFYVMELLEGVNLMQLIERVGGVSPHAAVLLLRQVAIALDAVHEQGIVHRDLNPNNIFLTQRYTGAAEIKLLDFGVAKLMGSFSTTQIVGTRNYIAPEQLTGKDIDQRSDVYALGQVAGVMLCGPGFFDAKDRPPERWSAAVAAWHDQATAQDKAARFERASLAVKRLAEVLGLSAVTGEVHYRELFEPPAPLTREAPAGLAFAPTQAVKPSAQPRWVVAAAIVGAAAALGLMLRALRDDAAPSREVEVQAALTPVAAATTPASVDQTHAGL